MIQNVTTNYANYPATDVLAVPSTKAKAKAALSNTANAADNASASGTSSSTDISSTFLTLLVQELQNQDPTNPMDSTAMVGQMISLNQLDQLVSINQELSSTSTGGAGSSGASSGHSSGATGAAQSAAIAAAGIAQPTASPTTPNQTSLFDSSAAPFAS